MHNCTNYSGYNIFLYYFQNFEATTLTFPTLNFGQGKVVLGCSHLLYEVNCHVESSKQRRIITILEPVFYAKLLYNFDFVK